MDYNRWETFDLRAECTNRRLSAAGNKFGLVRRLVEDDVEKRSAKVSIFNKYNDPEGVGERQYIEEEICFKRWAHVTVSDAEIDYHTRQIAKATAQKRTGVEALVVERKEALLGVDKRVKGLPLKTGGEEDAMEVDCVPIPTTSRTAQKRSISPSATSKETKKLKLELEVDGQPTGEHSRMRSSRLG